jgi:ABC-type thiamin/hydroxymethylpyrimidine transport system permease subunit
VVLSVVVPLFVFCVVYFGLYSVLFRAVDGLHVALACIMVAILALGVALAAAGWALGWCLLVVMLSPFVVAVCYEAFGYRHVESDVLRES